ncbi:MFS transporter [Streptomyces sp. 3214.6]|uniref:MFS transporter n=1 Tax=Streptomyces sp. 3214.6 TaxID=1882757 RepID=UPI00090B20DB|nr:MFS transporter [Streptomyces sp. 3214.6]SHI24916.1 Major Facilitator Superfamily protein [Streptomyces sp. 3214.6]
MVCDDVERAEKYGWVTRAVPDAELDDLVNGVAARIASFDRASVLGAKAQINRSTLPPVADLRASWAEFAESVRSWARSSPRSVSMRSSGISAITPGSSTSRHRRRAGKRGRTSMTRDRVLPTGRRTAVQHRELLTLVAMCLGVMMTFLLITATISALSAIQADLHVSPSALIWIPSAYTLVVASLVLSAGTLGNLLGRKRMFCAGAVVMIAGGLLAATADTTAVVIAAQLISGLGGALILPNSLAILGSTFTDPQRRTEVITVWAAASGIGLAIGPLLAGVLLDHSSWHAVFVSNPVLGVITLLVAVPFATESLARGERLDVAGALLGTVTIAALVYALIQGGQDGYTAPPVMAAWIVTVVGAVAFVVVELRVAVPMLDVRLFASRSFSAELLERSGDRGGAATLLTSLLADMIRVRGSGHPRTREAAEAPARCGKREIR